MSQQYQLKIGVYSDERLQVADLLKYLQAETNDSIAAVVKRLALGAKPTERFTSTFQQVVGGEIEQQEYVGFLMIYNSSQFESIEYVKEILAELGLRGSDETFLVLVEMETKDKVNLANQEGLILAAKYNADFVRLSFESTGELLRTIGKYISLMLESYYHPASVIGQEAEQQEEGDYELNYISRDKQREMEENQANRPLFEEDEVQGSLLDRALEERKSRLQDISEQEKDIDTNIQNLQKVLQNMDVHIRSKLETDWFSNLKNSIYSRVEKESESYSKIKLTQHFLNPAGDSRAVQRIPVQTIMIKRRRNLLLRLQLSFNKSLISVDVYSDSSYAELAKISLRKIGLKLSNHNVSTMRSKIEQTIGAFVQQLSRSIQSIQQQKMASRRLLK